MAANWGGSNPPQLLLVQTREGRPLPVLFRPVGGRAAGAKGVLAIFFNFSSCLTRCRREGEGSAPPLPFQHNTGRAALPLPFRHDKGRAQPLPSHYKATRGGFSPPPPVSMQHGEGSPSLLTRPREGQAPPVPFLHNTGRVNPFPSHWTWHMGSF